MPHSLGKKIIWIDIDDVLALTIPNLVTFMKGHLWVDINYEEVLNYKFHEMPHFREKNIWKMEIHDMWNAFFRSEHWSSIGKVSGSEEAIEKLLQDWFEIHLITARWIELEDITRIWLEKNFPSVTWGWLHFTGSYSWKTKNKSEICTSIWISLMIDDNIENCLDLEKNWIRSYLLTRPWNANHSIENSNIKRVSDWSEIIK